MVGSAKNCKLKLALDYSKTWSNQLHVFFLYYGGETLNCRCIRGAISVTVNKEDAIINATRELLEKIVARNNLLKEDLAGVLFTATPDLDTAYPAIAARDMGWADIPLLCAQEMVITNSLQRCIRVMLFWNTKLPPDEIKHIYLDEARTLRPDLVKNG